MITTFKLFEEFDLKNIFRKGTVKDVIKKIVKTNPMTKDDDASTNYLQLLYKAYDSNCLYLKTIYGKIREELYTGVIFVIPYSDGDKRNIKIIFDNYYPNNPVIKINDEDPLGEEDWNETPEIGENPSVRIYDTPDDRFSGKSGANCETYDIRKYLPALRYIDLLRGTKYDAIDRKIDKDGYIIKIKFDF